MVRLRLTQAARSSTGNDQAGFLLRD